MLEVILAGSAGCATAILFVKWADNWLKNKRRQVGELNDSLFHSFLSVMRDTSDCFSQYESKNDDEPVTRKEFYDLIRWAKPINEAVQPILRFDSILERLSVKLRQGAASWIICVISGIFAVLTEKYSLGSLLSELTTILIVGLLSVLALASLIFSLSVFFYALYISNCIDKRRTGMSSIRTWRFHD